MFYLEKSYLNIALPGQEHFARTMSPNAMSNMADSGVVTIAICHFWLQHDIPVKSVTWMWQEWSGELLRQMLYEMDCKMFFSKGCYIHDVFHWCMQRLAHTWLFSIFECPCFLLHIVCQFHACIAFITCMIMHTAFLCAFMLQNLFASHSWNMHTSSTSCMGIGETFGSDLCCDMAHFEQASLLATAWANTDGVKERALKHAIVQVSSNKKIKRSRWLSGCENKLRHVCEKKVVEMISDLCKHYNCFCFCICCLLRWLEAERGCDRAFNQALWAQTIACYVWTGSAPIFLFSTSKRPRFLLHLWHC